MKNDFTLIPAPANDHRAISLVERLISTIKQRLACIKEANKELNSFTIKAALKLILNQLRICKHKTTKFLPFESHFGRKANTPHSNISTKPHPSNLSYERILNHFINEETVTPNELLPEEHWGNYGSGDEMEKNMCKAVRDASTRERNADDSEPRFLSTTKANRPIPSRNTQCKSILLGRKNPIDARKRTLTGFMRC